MPKAIKIIVLKKKSPPLFIPIRTTGLNRKGDLKWESDILPGHVAPEENLFPFAPAQASQVWLSLCQAAKPPFFCSVTIIST